MAKQYSTLFQPLEIGSLRIPGRVFKTATTETMSTDDGYITDQLVEFYEHFAKAGTPLIFTGNFYTLRSGRVYKRMPGADSDDKLPGMRRLAETAHQNGSKICAQLSHAGRQVFQPSTNPDPVSASNVRDKFSGIKPRALDLEEIDEIIRSFAEAAQRCKRAGFDAIQIHAAQGYLINQFLTPYTNRRSDRYGGDFENRLRLLIEIIRETRALVGDDYPIIVKLNGDDALPLRKGLKAPDLVKIAQRLETEGVDAIEVTVGHYESGFPTIRGNFDRFFDTLLNKGVGHEYPAPKLWMMRRTRRALAALSNRLWPHKQGFNRPYASYFKSKIGIPVICVGGFQTPEAMNAAVAAGDCDAVSVARAMIADPYMVRHIKLGEQGPSCEFCSSCLANIGSRALTCDHPSIAASRAKMLGYEAQRGKIYAA